jgi:two-component sensor histidine kinase
MDINHKRQELRKRAEKLVSEDYRIISIDRDLHDFDDVLLDIDHAIPLGLIMNELLSHCLKHAFPNTQTGEISIEFFEGMMIVH